LLPDYFEDNDKKTLDDLNTILPEIPSEILLDSLVQVYLNDPDFEFKKRLRENNLTEWKPVAPMQLCYCKGDREVSYENSEVAYRSMKEFGVKDLKLNNQSDYLDHNTCAAFTVLSTKYFFDRYKKKGGNPKMKDLPPFKKFLVGFLKRSEEKKYKKTKSDESYFGR
jgi:hypothetical protein